MATPIKLVAQALFESKVNPFVSLDDCVKAVAKARCKADLPEGVTVVWGTSAEKAIKFHGGEVVAPVATTEGDATVGVVAGAEETTPVAETKAAGISKKKETKVTDDPKSFE